MMEFDCVSITGGGSVGECDRLSQSSWLLGTLWCSVTYFLSSFNTEPLLLSCFPSRAGLYF